MMTAFAQARGGVGGVCDAGMDDPNSFRPPGESYRFTDQVHATGPAKLFSGALVRRAGQTDRSGLEKLVEGQGITATFARG